MFSDDRSAFGFTLIFIAAAAATFIIEVYGVRHAALEIIQFVSNELLQIIICKGCGVRQNILQTGDLEIRDCSVNLRKYLLSTRQGVYQALNWSARRVAWHNVPTTCNG